jgi:hypothetical protein
MTEGIQLKQWTVTRRTGGVAFGGEVSESVNTYCEIADLTTDGSLMLRKSTEENYRFIFAPGRWLEAEWRVVEV